MNEKYNSVSVIKSVEKSAQKAIEESMPWFLRDKYRIILIALCVVSEAVLTLATIHSKLDEDPVLTFVITLMASILLNVPQDMAGIHFRAIVKGNKENKLVDIIMFVLIEISFVAMQIPLSIIKLSVAPDLLGDTSSLDASATSFGGFELAAGMGWLFIVSSVASSIFCFALGVARTEESIKKSAMLKYFNRNYKTIAKLAAAQFEYSTIGAAELNENDMTNQNAAQEVVRANTVSQKISFRDKLMPGKNLNADAINDVTDNSQAVVDSFKNSKEMLS